MKDPNPFSCDGPSCTQRKQPSNNWWMRDCYMLVFSLGPWDDAVADEKLADGKPRYEHFCSRECSGKSLDKWFQKQATAPAPAIAETAANMPEVDYQSPIQLRPHPGKAKPTWDSDPAIGRRD